MRQEATFPICETLKFFQTENAVEPSVRFELGTFWVTDLDHANKSLRGSPPLHPHPPHLNWFSALFWDVEVWHVGHPLSEKRPPNYCDFFTTGHWGPLWSQRKTGLLFSGYFSKFWKPFSCDGQTDTLKGCRLSNLPVERINTLNHRAISSYEKRAWIPLRF
jgi:hypothetical protein